MFVLRRILVKKNAEVPKAVNCESIPNVAIHSTKIAKSSTLNILDKDINNKNTKTDFNKYSANKCTVWVFILSNKGYCNLLYLYFLDKYGFRRTISYSFQK